MPKYWLISDRNNNGVGPDPNQDGLTFWTSEGGPLNNIGSWTKTTQDQFQAMLLKAADAFPVFPPSQQEKQRHVTLLVHGFNVSFNSSTLFYQKICDQLFTGDAGLGICILYDWPSEGSVAGYEPDRSHARECAEDLTDVLSSLYEQLLSRQQAAIKNTGDACKAKVSLIAHSMGNYLLQKAMTAAWTRKNKPLLVSLLNQLVMVAADVDNDLFDAGAADNADGEAIANLVYRITALYSGRDAVLGLSSGFKHFGTRRLGRSGLAHKPPLVDSPPQTDNVWDVDCSSFFPANDGSMDIHGAYFDTPEVMSLIRMILQGIDRTVLAATGATQGHVWPPPPPTVAAVPAINDSSKRPG